MRQTFGLRYLETLGSMRALDDALSLSLSLYRLVQKKGTVLQSTRLAWPAVAGCSRADTFSQLSAISFAQPCMCPEVAGKGVNRSTKGGRRRIAASMQFGEVLMVQCFPLIRPTVLANENCPYKRYGLISEH